MNKKQLLFKIALALMAIVTTLCIYAPAIIYFAQREYFSNYYLELISAPVLYCGGLALLLWVIFSMLPRTVLKYVSAVLMVMAVLMWLQSDLFSVSYGTLDGSNINFDRFSQRGMWELVVIAISLILALMFNQAINKRLPLVIGLVMLGQWVLTGINITHEPADKPTIKELDQEFFNYSSKKNIIVIILDTFGGDVFEDILLKHPEFKDEYNGFVSYTDAISNYPATKGSLPSLLTGQMIPKDFNLVDFIDEVVSQKGLPAFYEDQGFEVSVISVFSWFRNFYAKRYMSEPPFLPEDLKLYNAATLFDYALFRLMPHIFKEQVYDQGTWLVSSQVATHTEIPNTEAERANLFLEMMTDHANVAGEVPRFKLIHVTTPHPKFVFDQHCQKGVVAENATTQFSMEQQSICALRKLEELLKKYKTLDIYDDSLIVVTSDHGDRNFEDKSLTGFPSYFEMNSSGILFMIKGVDQNEKFKQVDQPVSLLKLFNALTETSLHKTKYDFLTDLNRPFYAFRNSFIGSSGMIQDAPLYTVAANYQNPDSWHLKEFVVNQCEALAFPINMVFKSTVREQYCGIFGFVPDYVKGDVWTESVDSRVVFNLDATKIDNQQHYSIEINLKPRLFEQQNEITVSVQLNNMEIGEMLINESIAQTHTFNFPAEFFKLSGIQELRLSMPELKSENQLGIGESTHVLGLMLKSINISIDS